MKGHERFVSFFELKIDTNKEGAVPPTFVQVVDTLRHSLGTSTAQLKINRETATVELKSIDVDNNDNIVTFFIRISDTTASDVHYVNADEGTSRAARKHRGEGRGFSTHFMVSLTHEIGKADRYLALLERVQGLSSAIVTRLLQAILRTMYQADGNLFVCDDVSGRRVNGRPKQIGFRPMLELSGLPSEQFLADLEAGSLQEIQLIEQKEGSQFASRSWLIERARSIRLTLGQGVPANRWEALKEVFKAQSAQGYKTARIKFKRADGKTENAEIDSETGDLLDQRYVKSTRISNIIPPLEEYADAVVPHFQSRMRSELVANRS